MHPTICKQVTAIGLYTLLFFLAAHVIIPSPFAAAPVRFAVIGDYGAAAVGPQQRAREQAVAELVRSWNPDFIITVGDNNYENGAASTLVQNIGQYYCGFIRNPDAPSAQRCNPLPTFNRFFPSLGNHDWNSLSCSGEICTGPYFNYFTLTSPVSLSGYGERYYDFVGKTAAGLLGPVHFFAIDSDPHEPHGEELNGDRNPCKALPQETSCDSRQVQWLKNRLSSSQSPWKLVYLHHAPFSSGDSHGSDPRMQWPYQKWGAHTLLAGHDHTYERIRRGNFLYFVNGLGGRSRDSFAGMDPVCGSRKRYSSDYGAMLVEASDVSISLRFYSRTKRSDGTYPLIDSTTLVKHSSGLVSSPVDACVENTFGDAEEKVTNDPPSNGLMSLNSTDLELVYDGSTRQMVGMRFNAIPIPPGATITKAYSVSG